ncbi:hypothetical protein CU098_004762 [Rhizopus stolonifer]|uniref:Endoplasmic reticulum junction formation protein lunapark n=1 Tax=Rhizopus stolonifer TaxID=4846 RepID=A0A367IJM6_RHIST|nr:hypothetical protein CU098_004762 [Rhizopus stolonifer]
MLGFFILSLFRKEQKEKIEELKKKTSYYTTQSLIERYDDAKKKAMDPKSEKANDMRQRKPGVLSAPNHAPNNAPNNTPNNATPQPMRHVPINAPKYPTPIMPQQPKSQPQWYDRLVDALVGDAGPETKYALICTHCFAHNGLVLKEEYDTIQYVCPMCKQFNPSRKQDVVKALLEDPKEKERDESMALVKDEPEIQDESLVSSRALRNALRELKKAVEQDEENGKSSTIAGRVRQRHNKTSEAEEE